MLSPRALAMLAALAGTLVLHAPLAAQLQSAGVRLGLARASQTGGFADLVEDLGGRTESRTGFTLGGFVTWAIPGHADRLAVQTGLEITQKGTRIPPENGVAQRSLDLTYLEIPALLRASFGDGPYRPHLVAGPVLGFTMGTYGEVRGQEVDVDDEVTGTDLGLALGAGVRRGAFGIELRYVFGLTDVTESTDEDEGARNRHWALAGTWEVPLGR